MNEEEKLSKKSIYPTASIQRPHLSTKAIHQAPVVQKAENFNRWKSHFSGPKIYFTLNVVQGFPTLPNLHVAVVKVCVFACKRGDTEIFVG